MPLAVGASQYEARQIVLDDQRFAALRGGEMDMYAVGLHGVALIDGGCEGSLMLAVGLVQCDGSHAATHFALRLGVDILGIAQVYVAHHTRVGQAQSIGL